MRSVQDLADVIIDNSLVVQASLRQRWPLTEEARRRRTEAIAKIKGAVREITERQEQHALCIALERVGYGADRVGLADSIMCHMREAR